MIQQLARWLPFLALSICSVAAPTTSRAAEQEVLDDLTARIQFDFYAADARTLQRDVQALKELEPSDSSAQLQRYYLAYGYMKLADTLVTTDRAAAHKAATECVEQTEIALAQKPKRINARERRRIDTWFGELWAMKAECATHTAELSLTTTSLSSNRARNTAAELAPDSPRVQLLAVIHEIRHAKKAAERDAASRKLSAVVALFDNAPEAEAGTPDWGQAEALAWLGQSYVEHGEKISARNTLERALVLAPDYAWARALQSQLKTGK